ncbi:GspE/PulE family protein [Candidatus Berkiella cookevillensis]|uniref:GspE/PulE family protein n=1 Tax=Candidatus Berkiella cookevillensis TaxID=437022 RepID=A0A0Q9YE73_9GAMM|nr:GspE/PulE family protein [Candidatus Berkiella cookevillensis]MCS5709657.1 GspE/PulE family protein [Candidatus Berkiella cookevillensis]
MKKIKLGDLLVEQKVISPEDLSVALSVQKQTGQRLGAILIEKNILSEEHLLSFLADQLNLPFIDLKHYRVKKEIVGLLPEILSRRYKMLPIDLLNDSYLVVTSDPTDILAYDQISAKLKKTIRLAVAQENDIIDLLNTVYKKSVEIKNAAGEIEFTMRQAESVAEYQEILESTPIKKLLYSILEEAYLNRASDIHLEPGDNFFRIRHRIDGILSEQIIHQKTVFPSLILRIKLMANLDISEHRLPQDGRFSIVIQEREIDVRVAIIALNNQEAVVMRLLDKTMGILRLESLGMSDSALSIFKKHIYFPHGMVLVCGPTGSGKTTTLYSALAAINTPEKKIITVEDPVEYLIPRVNQIQVQPKIGLDFATILRSVLRHDPDIILVGEIRDLQTADIALKAALTGHLVFSTVHTYDAISAPIRLVDMGVPSYLIASSVKLIVAQRLLKRICEKCKKMVKPDLDEENWIKNNFSINYKEIRFYKGVGCSACNMLGYKGRVGIYEILSINDKIASALRSNDFEFYTLYAREAVAHQSLIEQALRYAIEGVVTLSEALHLSVEIDMDAIDTHEKLSLSRHKSERQ